MSSTVVSWLFGGWSFGAARHGDELRKATHPETRASRESETAGDELGRDAAFIAQLRAGDESAFHTLWTQHYAELVAFAARHVEAHRAADLVQDVFLAVWMNRATLAPRTTMAAHLYRRLWHLILRSHRRGRVEHAYVERQRAAFDTSANVTAPESTRALDAHDMRALLDSLLSAMTPRVRQIFLMSRLDGLSAPEIAVVLHLSPQVVRNQLSRATKILARGIASLDLPADEP